MTHPKQRAKGRAQQSTRLINGLTVVPIWELFADEYDATVERMARAYLNAKAQRMRFDFSWKNAPESVRDNARSGIMAAFASIGIAAPQGRARK